MQPVSASRVSAAAIFIVALVACGPMLAPIPAPADESDTSSSSSTSGDASDSVSTTTTATVEPPAEREASTTDSGDTTTETTTETTSDESSTGYPPCEPVVYEGITCCCRGGAPAGACPPDLAQCDEGESSSTGIDD